MMGEQKVRFVAIGLGLVAVGAIVVSVLAMRAADEAETDAAVAESRWLAAVAVSGDYPPSQSRLLAVEAQDRSQTPEAKAAIGTVLFADARTKPPVAELEHDGPVWATDAAPSADVVATGSDDATVKLWTPEGELLATLAHEARLRAIDFSDNEQTVVTGAGDGTVTAWTLDGEMIVSISHTEQVNDVAISDGMGVMVSGGHDGVMLVTETDTGEVRHELTHPDFVWSVAVSDNAALVASGSKDGMATIWDPETGAEVSAHDLGEPVTVLHFSPDGQWLFAGGQVDAAMLINVESGEPGPVLEGSFFGGVIDAAWHPDTAELAVVSLFGINRFDMPSGEVIAVHQVAGGARGAAYGPDGSWLATGSGDFEYSFGAVTFWDTSSNAELVALNLSGPVESIAVHSSGKVLAGFRSTQDLVEIGGAWLVPGPGDWVELACDGSDGVISEETWTALTGELGGRETACP